ncbi:glycerophosphodiester phosphodiesterase family protein [Oceanibacterium hippocampi]|uniref:Cytoplasmic glycerophosphodiester phosphodiesterase n=1 Tax=Oceanibacterium hippocampi TaxID=745714 RepID=A0A1Y5SME2_9PROT|nr:glycerophosphodiester phosphodiesterase family protein [Oceanibacterium hippocampi]SLN43710.1 cytoplasmic glycerophosphodiester phosphodiesterase [Oceanibacterium hippocampi]
MTTLPGWLKATPFAHRGLHGPRTGLPENSIAAFQAAVGNGYGIELDVQLSADAVPMVFHDDSLDRLTGESGALARQRAAALGAIRLKDSDETIPTLAATLAAVAGRTPILVEIKGRGRGAEAARRAAQTWAVLESYRGPYTVQSFNPHILAWFRAHAPDVVRGQIAGKFRGGEDGLSWHQRFALETLMVNRISDPHYVAYDVKAIDAHAPQRSRLGGRPLLAWTIRDEAALERARRFADNVIFENVSP